MRTFSTSMTAAVSAEQAMLVWMLQMSFDSTYYYTNCDIDIIYNSNRYISRGFEITDISQTPNFNQDVATLRFDNVGREISGIVLGEDAANKTIICDYAVINPSTVAVGAESILLETGDSMLLETGDGALLESSVTAGNYMVQGKHELLRGYVTSWELTEQEATIKIGSEFMLWSKKTLRLPTPNCPWSFKGTECAYAGAETWCDKSPERCVSLANYVNFGGRKFISDLEGKKIFWGPKGY